MKRLLLPCFAVIAALGITTAAHAADVGRVLLAAGDTVAIRGNQTVRLTFGTMVQDKDLLRTGAASNLQVRFIDESIVSMKEASELRIDEFQFSGKEDGKERGFFSLLKGGLRTVTGLVGRTNNASYRLSTTTATIGIRGTDYAATLCQGDCRNNDGSLARDGLYGRTHGISHGTNRIDVSNERDQKSFGINENFYVADAKSIVEPLLVAPDFVSSKLEGRKQGGGKGESGGSGTEQATTGGAAAESRPSTTPEPLPQLQFVATQDLGPQGTPAVLLPPANGFAVVSPVAGAFFDADSILGTYNSLNQLTGYGTMGIFPAGSLNSGTITDTGGFTLSTGQVITWGRWTGGTLIMSGTGPTVTGSPLLFVTASGVGNDFISSLGGVATYTYAGGPSPVDAGGNVGSITSTSATLNFTLQTATLALGVNFPSIVVANVNTGAASFSMSGSGVRFIGTVGGDWAGGLSGICTGSGCQGGTGPASGFFVAGTTGANGYEFAVFDGFLGITNAGVAVFLNTYLNSSFTPPTTTTPTIAGLGAFFNPLTPLDPNDGGGFLTPANMTTEPAGAAANLATPQILTGFTIPPGFNAEPGGGTIAVTASVSSSSVNVIDETAPTPINAHWGRWTSGTFTDTPSSTTFSPNNQFHYLYGPLTPPEVVAGKTGTFPMSMVAGTTPTNQLGQTGTFSTNVVVNFSTQQVAFNTSTFTFPSDTWTFSGGITPIQIRAGQGAFIDQVTTGTCSGSTCFTSTPAVLGKTGIFMGPAGDHLGVAFSARTTSGPTAHAQTVKIFTTSPF